VLEEALVASRQPEAGAEEARMLTSLGWYWYGRDQLRGELATEAEAHFRQAVEAAERLGNLYCLLAGKLGLGWCAVVAGRAQEAVDWFDQVSAGAPRDAHQELPVAAGVGRAAARHRIGDLAGAAQGYGAMIPRAEEGDFRRWAARALVGLGATQWHSGERQEAEAAWRRARTHARNASPQAEQLTESNIQSCQIGPTVPPR
jgi:tetratricopeptide (TPR) repeat protein